MTPEEQELFNQQRRQIDELEKKVLDAKTTSQTTSNPLEQLQNIKKTMLDLKNIKKRFEYEILNGSIQETCAQLIEKGKDGWRLMHPPSVFGETVYMILEKENLQ